MRYTYRYIVAVIHTAELRSCRAFPPCVFVNQYEPLRCSHSKYICFDVGGGNARRSRARVGALAWGRVGVRVRVRVSVRVRVRVGRRPLAIWRKK